MFDFLSCCDADCVFTLAVCLYCFMVSGLVMNALAFLVVMR